MISVYKTNVEYPVQAVLMIALLTQRFPTAEINFDLDDCDKILRVKGKFCQATVQYLLEENGFLCSLLN